MCWKAGIRFPAGPSDFSLLHSFQTGSGADPAYPMGTDGSFPSGKEAGGETDLSRSSSAGVKNGGAMSLHPYVFMTWCLIN
jgi:hypothetical protein